MKITIKITVFLLILNSFAGLLQTAGWCADAGICPDPGGDDVVDAANASATELKTTQSSQSDTLFTALSTSASQVIEVVKLIVAGGPLMLINMGVPSALVTFLFSPAYILIMADAAHWVTGRNF